MMASISVQPYRAMNDDLSANNSRRIASADSGLERAAGDGPNPTGRFVFRNADLVVSISHLFIFYTSIIFGIRLLELERAILNYLSRF